jgi:hypothetical protein
MSEGFEIPGWPCGDYSGSNLATMPAGAEILTGSLCFIRHDGSVSLATASVIVALRSPWQRVRHDSWDNGYKCRVSGNTLIVYRPGGAKQRLPMLPETAVLVRPNGDVVALDLRTLRLPRTRAAEGAWRITVHDVCPSIILPKPPAPVPQGAPVSPMVFGGAETPLTTGGGWANNGSRPTSGRWG